MTTFDTTVTVWFGETATASTVFTLNDPVRGVLDNTTYTLGGDVGTDVTGYTNRVSFTRGKTSPLFDDIDPASGTVQLNNETRLFDPLYTAGTFYGDFTPGKRVEIATNGVTIFDGRTREWATDYNVSGRSVATVTLEDYLGLLGRQQFDAWTTTAGQLSGARISAVLDRPEVNAPAARNIGTGASTLQADAVSWGSNVLNYLQLVTRSDAGQFFCSREGVLTFEDRNHVANGNVELLLSDTGPIYFHGLRTSQTGDTYTTRVSVDAVGYVAQTVTAANVGSDGVRSMSLSGLLMDSEQQALDMATFLANTYSIPDPSIDEISINLNVEQFGSAPSGIQLCLFVLAVDVSSVIELTFTPNGVGSPIVQRLVVDGIRHDIDTASHMVTFYTSKADGRSVFTLDDPTFGILDGAAVLGF